MIMPDCNDAKLSEVDKQRLIGKQLVLVDIIHEENDRALRGGVFYPEIDDFARWASVDKDEMEAFINVCASLDKLKLCECAAKKYAYDCRLIDGDYAYLFLLYTFQKNSYYFVHDLDLNSISEICEVMAESNYTSYCDEMKNKQVGENCSNTELFELIVLGFLDYYTSVVKEAVALGFDWDVVNRMCRFDVSRNRFDEIVSICETQQKSET